MTNYISENEINLTFEDRNGILICQMCDIDGKAKRKWKDTNITCDICEIGEDLKQKKLTKRLSKLFFVDIFF